MAGHPGSPPDPFPKELGSIAENWAVYTLLQGCYVREYHEWERAVERYFASQRRSHQHGGVRQGRRNRQLCPRREARKRITVREIARSYNGSASTISRLG